MKIRNKLLTNTYIQGVISGYMILTYNDRSKMNVNQIIDWKYKNEGKRTMCKRVITHLTLCILYGWLT